MIRRLPTPPPAGPPPVQRQLTALNSNDPRPRSTTSTAINGTFQQSNTSSYKQALQTAKSRKREEKAAMYGRDSAPAPETAVLPEAVRPVYSLKEGLEGEQSPGCTISGSQPR